MYDGEYTRLARHHIPYMAAALYDMVCRDSIRRHRAPKVTAAATTTNIIIKICVLTNCIWRGIGGYGSSPLSTRGTLWPAKGSKQRAPVFFFFCISCIFVCVLGAYRFELAAATQTHTDRHDIYRWKSCGFINQFVPDIACLPRNTRNREHTCIYYKTHHKCCRECISNICIELCSLLYIPLLYSPSSLDLSFLGFCYLYDKCVKCLC